VEVEDTGPGIPLELRDRLFERYVRGKNATTKPGIGLGLATVKRVSQAHGGAVGMRPGPEQGSVFWFEIPRADPLPKTVRERPANAELESAPPHGV
jgi:signal transduction histidine kinase